MTINEQETKLLLSLLRDYRKFFTLYEDIFGQTLDTPRLELESLIYKLTHEEKDGTQG